MGDNEEEPLVTLHWITTSIYEDYRYENETAWRDFIHGIIDCVLK